MDTYWLLAKSIGLYRNVRTLKAWGSSAPSAARAILKACGSQNFCMCRYEGFHLTVLGEITGYPELVRKELDWYDSALCQYLGVSRTPIKVTMHCWECCLWLVCALLCVTVYCVMCAEIKEQNQCYQGSVW